MYKTVDGLWKLELFPRTENYNEVQCLIDIGKNWI